MSSDFSFSDFVNLLDATHEYAFPSFSAPYRRSTDPFRYEKSAWELLQLLDESRPHFEDDASKCAQRKQNFSHFWKKLVTPSAVDHARQIDLDPSDNAAEEKALAYLSGFDVWNATEVLISSGNYRLATMIAQIDGPSAMRDMIRDQINLWIANDSISEIPDAIRALYELLAGETDTAQGKDGFGLENRASTFGIAKKFRLDWRRAFGLRLWYGLDERQDVRHAIEEYDLSMQEGRTVYPVRASDSFGDLPTGLSANKSGGCGGMATVPEGEDILFHLLSIYSNVVHNSDRSPDSIADSLRPENTSPTGNPLDARLSFQLYHTLKAKDVIEDFHDWHAFQDAPEAETDPDGVDGVCRKANDHRSDGLTALLLASLSTAPKDLCDAVFVALHFASAVAREKYVQELLARHASALDLDLTVDLHPHSKHVERDTHHLDSDSNGFANTKSLTPSPTGTSGTNHSSGQSAGVAEYLTTALRIPPAWLYRAKAGYAAHVESDARLQTVCLLRAGDVSAGHDVLKKLVGPKCVIEEDMKGLKEVLAIFEASGVVEGVSGATDMNGGVGVAMGGNRISKKVWESGGGLFGKFVELMEVMRGTSGNMTSNRDLRRLAHLVEERLPREEEWKYLSLEERVAVCEMTNVVDEVQGQVEHGLGGNDGVDAVEKMSEAFYGKFPGAIGVGA